MLITEPSDSGFASGLVPVPVIPKADYYFHLGEAYVPTPVLVGDLVALHTGSALKIVSVLHAPDGAPVGVQVRPVKMPASLEPWLISTPDKNEQFA